MDRSLDSKQIALMLAVVFFATFMDGLDGSIVNVALPSIGKDFGMDTATVSWVSITYMMVLAGTLVAFAKIAADTGVRRIMSLGLMLFTVSSLFCGISVSFPMLIASRVVQAVGAGMMAAAGPMCCTKHLPVHRLAFGLSVVTIGASLGFALGPAIGGAVLEIVSWHWIFLMNIPLGTIAIPLMLMAVPRNAEEEGRIHLDIRGTILLFAAIVLITFSIEILSYREQRLTALLSAALGLFILGLFIAVEKRTADPLLDLSMFKRWDFTAIFICLMFINMVFMGMLYLIPFFTDVCMGISSFTTGMTLLLSALVTAIFGMPFAKLSDSRGRGIFCISSGLLIGFALILMAAWADGMTLTMIIFLMVPMGLSWACVGGPMASRLVEHAEDRNMASSLTNEAYYIGGAIGTALGALSFTIFSNTDGIDIQEVSSSAFLDGFVPTAVIFTVFSIIIAILSFAVRDERKE